MLIIKGNEHPEERVPIFQPKVSKEYEQVRKKIATKFWVALRQTAYVGEEYKHLINYSELSDGDFKASCQNFADQILSTPELARYFRKGYVKLDPNQMPKIPEAPIFSDKPYCNIEKRAFHMGALTYRNIILKYHLGKANKEK